MKKHCHLILNPAAGKGRALKRLPEALRFFSDRDITYTIHETEKQGHAAQIAASLAEQEHHHSTIIVSAGGDGTCNEVINGLMNFRNIKNEAPLPDFAVLPMGRGNDFSFGAGLPLTMKDALENLVQERTVNLDVGWIRGGKATEGRYFANGVGIGFDAIVNAEAAKIKYFQGYTLAALKTIVVYPDAPEVELTYDRDKMVTQAALISIMNGKRLGGAFLMAPDGDMTDGLLDLTTSHQGNRRVMISALWDYYRGKQKKRKDTFVTRAVKFRIVSQRGALVIHADGETLSTEAEEVEVHCLPAALRLLKKK